MIGTPPWREAAIILEITLTYNDEINTRVKVLRIGKYASNQDHMYDFLNQEMAFHSWVNVKS